MKILLTGSTGQLGKEIIKNKPNYVDLIIPNRNILNLEKEEDCYNSIKKIKPDWVINSGAYTNVENAEKNQKLAFKINCECPCYFAKAIGDFGGKLLQLSTDFVFDGNQNTPYSPKDQRNPINVYGKSKAEGEILIEKTLPNSNKYLILRTSWLMGPIGKNFAINILKLLKERETLSIVNDQYGSPTSTNSLTKVIWKIIECDYKNQYINMPNILHWSDSGIASWYDVAVQIKEIAIESGILRHDKLILPISSSKYPTFAKRPKFSVLNSTLTNNILNLPHNHWRSSLKDFMKLIKY